MKMAMGFCECLSLFFLLFVISSCKSRNSFSCPSERALSEGHISNVSPLPSIPIHSNGINTKWNWQLKGEINKNYNVDVYDVDLFDTPRSVISDLKDQGKKVICYFSAGSSENWREDYAKFKPEDLGSPLEGWLGERWLDIRSKNVFTIMKERIDLALTKNCDAVEPDNLDAFQNDQCFSLTSEDQLNFNRAIANYARSKALSVGLKNDPNQVSSLVDYFDFSVSEQCQEYSECDSYQPFINQNKPVFNAEYKQEFRADPERSRLCQSSRQASIRTLILDLELDDSFRYSCD